MRMFNKVTIIGVGLIGGSIGLAVKKSGLAEEVTGVFRRSSTMKKALKRKSVDKGTMSVRDGMHDADLIILATPVSSIPLLARDAVDFAKEGAIITDVGSTKRWITAQIDKMTSRSGIFFVGSHPMAGSEHTGVEFARDDLMEGAPCIVVKTVKTRRSALRKVTRFWRALGAEVEVMSPSRHDKSVSLISHLPHIIAFSLAGAVPAKEIAYAAEGFKDTTRVASSDPELWADIFMTNKAEVVKAGKLFINYFNTIKKALSDGDYGKLVRILRRSKAKRDKFVIYGKKR
ncbi:MAG: prephenate dehydrogenase [Candidatus Omnitrophota bacterium]|nr:prephenate dehydrogenase [Candidatus Omnitrophota bacterium]